MEKSNEIYLVTIKNPLSQETNAKKAFRDINEALAEFRNVLQAKVGQGYESSEQSYVTETQYIKTAKLTNKSGNTIRLRLENIPFVSR
ncbi:MAG: hypothetical protein IJ064_05660 [Bacteroidaceae bacterium]|nr:hypothetical protein [Bacteroidaceae bacterium]